MPSPILSVAQYLELVNLALRTVPSEDFLIEGEISDFRVAQQKWVSFDLKDQKDSALLKCFMTTWQLKIPIENGMRVQVQGYAKVYERFGTFKLNVTQIAPVGEGALRRSYELLKAKLQAEGLFDLSRKRMLPRFPQRIGLITSRDAAAYGDFMRILNNRWGGISVQFIPVAVQGRDAVPAILTAFGYFNAMKEEERPEVIVLTRGGGGLEELHAFNDEAVARAVYASRVPVVCAVGHERDESLCDFVADVRASTPSNAAERIVPSREEILYEIQTISQHIESRLKDALLTYHQTIDHATNSAHLFLAQQAQKLFRLQDTLAMHGTQWLIRLQERILSHERVLKELDPARVLSRGFSIVRSKGSVVKDASKLAVGDTLQVQFAVGCVQTQVRSLETKTQQQLL